MTSAVNYMNHSSSYRDKFDQGKRNLARVSGEFDFIRVRVDRVKMTEKWDQIQVNGS